MRSRSISLVVAFFGLMSINNAIAQTSDPSPLLAIDQHRATVVERIVAEWGDKLTAAHGGVNREQLREMLFAMRADQLLAASLAGSLTGLRDVLAHTLTSTAAAKPNLIQAKALGDSANDVVYTPVTPCRLVETRGTFAAVYQGGGAFGSNEIRNYTVQGGNRVCLSQLPAGLNPAAIQVQVFGMPTTAGSGDLEILPEGSSFGSTATMVYIGSIAFNTVSTNAKVNLANNQIGVQVRGGGAHVAIDVVGYFKRPGNYGGTHTITGQFATDSGGLNNTASGFSSTVAGGEANTASGQHSTVAGGNANTASGHYSTVVGGFGNTASGHGSIAMGAFARADGLECATFSLWGEPPGMPCFGISRIFLVGAPSGMAFDYFSQRADGGGTRWVAIGRFPTQTISTWTGAFLTDSGVWVNASSSKASKTDFAPVDGRQVLAQVVRLPITTWRYREGEGEVRHMGPMAEDFDAAFGMATGRRRLPISMRGAWPWRQFRDCTSSCAKGSTRLRRKAQGSPNWKEHFRNSGARSLHADLTSRDAQEQNGRGFGIRGRPLRCAVGSALGASHPSVVT